jgi:hypothetical protein
MCICKFIFIYKSYFTFEPSSILACSIGMEDDDEEERDEVEEGDEEREAR